MIWDKFRGTTVFILFLVCSGCFGQQLTTEEAVDIVENYENQAKTWVYPANADSYEANGKHPGCKDAGVYDFIVAGVGAAGSVVVNRLSEVKEWKVLGIEGGDEEDFFADIPYFEDYLRTTKYSWGYITEPQNYTEGYINNSMLYPAGKAIGGSSVINSMMYVRGNKKDFDDWEAEGNPGWSYEDVLPYFIQSEHATFTGANDGYHGTNGTLNVEHIQFYYPIVENYFESQRELGRYADPNFDYNGENQIGSALLQMNTLKGARFSDGRAFVYNITNRSNLRIIKNAYVTKVVIDKERKVARGVQFYSNNTCYWASVNKEVVLSAGAIQSPRILMSSGVGIKEHLQQVGIDPIVDLPVGNGLWNHEAYGSQQFSINITFGGGNLSSYMSEYLDNHTGLYVTPGAMQAVSFINLENPNSTQPLQEYLFHTSSPSTADYKTLENLYYYNEDSYKDVILPQTNYTAYTVFVTLLHPLSRGTIRLKSSNPFDYPIIDPNSFANSKDIDRLVAGVRDIVNFTNTEAFKRLNATIIPVTLQVCENYTWNTEAYWACMIPNLSSTVHHYAGTCKMGPRNDTTAVVDNELRVYGVKNLRVADASIIPVTLSGHTHAPAVMIGERVSHFLKEAHRYDCSQCD